MRGSIFAIFLTTSALLLTPARAQQYIIRDVGSDTPPESYGFGISDTGQVAGYFGVGYPTPGPPPVRPTGVPAAPSVAVPPPVINDLAAVFGGSNPAEFPGLGGQQAHAYGISSDGSTVVGDAQIESGAATHAFVKSTPFDGYALDLGTFGGTNSAARATDSGVIVGWAQLPGDHATHAFSFGGRGLYNGGQVTDLGTLGGTNSYATGITIGGSHIVGYSQIMGDGATHACAFPYTGPVTDLGTLGGTNSYAYAASGGYADDFAVGTSQIAGDGASHAFLLANGTFTDLGVLPGGVNSVARAINASSTLPGGPALNGTIVGYSGVRAGTHAFVYVTYLRSIGSNGNTLHDLNDLVPQGTGWELQHAEGVNTNGQISGYGTYYGQTHAFVLEPTSGYAWTASAVAAAPNGGSVLLWNNINGAASVWTVSANGTVSYSPAFGPFAGWKAQGVSASADSTIRLLWTNTDGRASVWTLHGTNAPTYGPTFGPFTGWTARKITAGANNSSLLLWTKTDGTASYWTVAANGSISYSPQFGPYTDANYGTLWTAVAVAGVPDGSARLLWDNADGTATFWQIDAGGSVHYGAVAVQSSYQGIGVGNNNNVRVLVAPLGSINGGVLATVMPNGTFNYGFGLGPFPGWTALALSVGADSTSRILWTNKDGRASVWTIGTDNVTTYSPAFGPY